MALLGVEAREILKNPLGKGWRFPFSFDTNGGVSVQGSNTDNEAIEMINQSLQTILGTMVGERVIERRFGSLLFLLIDEPINQFLEMEIKRYVIEAIERYEKRINITDTLIALEDYENGIVQISIMYQIIKTQRKGNLVYPYYLSQDT